MPPLMVNNGDEGGPWEPPQKPSLVGAWVAGLSGPVAKLGTWAGQYGTSRAATLVSDALVSSANGLELLTTGDYATAGASTMGSGRGAFSVSLWYQRRGATIGTGYPVIGCVAGAAAFAGLEFTRDADAIIIGTRATSGQEAAVVPTPSIGAWTHLAVSYDGTGLRIYLDGSQYGDAVESTRSLSMAAGTLRIGYRDGDYLSAYVDDLYAWDGVALSAAEVASLAIADPYRRGNL